MDAPMLVHPPVCLYTCIFICPPYICTPPGVYTPPMGPLCSQCSYMVLEHCMLWGGCFSALMCIGPHHPYLGVPPPYYPHSFVGYLCIVILRHISSYVGGLSPSIEGCGGCFLHHLGRLGGAHQLSAVHMFILIHFL